MFEYRVAARGRGPLSALAVILCGLLAATIGAGPASAYNPPFAALVVDVKTGQVLHEENADARRFPASLTKVMTLYMLFEQLEAGRLRLDSPLRVSARAAAEPPSKLGVRAGSTISVENAILALVTRSANDVAAVIAENISGSVDGFARLMTQRARELGMANTTFRNASGLPNPQQVSTARDLARLAIALQDRFPQYYHYFQRRSFNFNGATIGNHNRLLGRVTGVDGIKTGFIRASGFNLMTNAQHNGRHIVTIVLGGRSGAHRDQIVQRLVERHLPRAFAGARRTPLIGRPSGASAPMIAMAAPPAPPARPADLDPRPVATAPLDLAGMRPAVASAPDANTVTPGSLRAAPAAAPASASAFAAVSPALDVPLPPAPIPDVQQTASLVQPEPARPVAVTPTPIPPTPIRELALEVAAEAVEPAPEPVLETVAVAALATDVPLEIDVQAEGVAEGSVSPWVIQIAAVPSEDAAFDMLQRAQSRVGRMLINAVPFTEEVQTRGATLYRARFSGFDEAGDARDACEKLKSEGFDCFAVRS